MRKRDEQAHANISMMQEGSSEQHPTSQQHIEEEQKDTDDKRMEQGQEELEHGFMEQGQEETQYGFHEGPYDTSLWLEEVIGLITKDI